MLYSLNAAGGAVFTKALDNGNDNVSTCAKAFPNASDGVAIGGSVNARERMIRVSSSGVLVWTAIAPAPTVPSGNQVTAMAIEGANVVGVGRFQDFNNDSYMSSIYRVNGAVLERTLHTSGRAEDIQHLSGNEFIVGAKTQSGCDLLSYDRSTATLLLRGSLPVSSPSFLRKNGSRMLIGGPTSYHTFDLNTNGVLSQGSSLWDMWKDGVGASSHFALVGSDLPTGAGLFMFVGDMEWGLTYFKGATFARQTPIESVTDSSGARYVLSSSYDVLAPAAWVTKFTPSGTVAWIRQVVISQERHVTPEAIAYSAFNDTVVVLGSWRSSTLAACAINANSGTIAWNRKFAFSDYANNVVDAKVDPVTGQIWVATDATDRDGKLDGLFRISPSGNLLSGSYKNPNGLTTGVRELHRMSANRWAYLSVGNSGGEIDSARITFYDSAASEMSVYNFETTTSLPKSVASSVASNGDLVVGVQRSDGSLEVRRFDATTGVSEWNVSLTGNRGYTFKVAAIPGGGAYIASYRGSDSTYQLDQVTSAGTIGWSTTLAPTVTGIVDFEVDATDRAFFLGIEGSATTNAYVARYLTNGARSSQQRIAGTPVELGISGAHTDVLGHVSTRNRSHQVSLARYANP